MVFILTIYRPGHTIVIQFFVLELLLHKCAVAAPTHCECPSPRHYISGDEFGMAAVFGRIDEFNSKKEDWPQYVEHLDHFFAANGITDADKKQSIFLTVIGPATFRLLRSLLHPTKLEAKELCTALATHFKPTPFETVQRFKFHTRCRRQGESVAIYILELRALAEFCNFTNLEEMLRDRLVCGINHDRTQNRLLYEPKLTYEKALEIAQSQETAAQNLRELKNNPQPA